LLLAQLPTWRIWAYRILPETIHRRRSALQRPAIFCKHSRRVCVRKAEIRTVSTSACHRKQQISWLHSSLPELEFINLRRYVIASTEASQVNLSRQGSTFSRSAMRQSERRVSASFVRCKEGVGVGEQFSCSTFNDVNEQADVSCLACHSDTKRLALCAKNWKL